MEFLGEMNIYRESELSGDFEGEIRKEKSARKESGGLWRIRNQSPPAGNSTYSPRTGTSHILCYMVVIEMSKIFGNISEKDYIFT